jgi:hypothetical protein
LNKEEKEMNYKKESENISISEKQTDIRIAMDLVSKYYLIENSILIKFQQKAKKQLFQKAKDLIHTMTHPAARRLLMIIIRK